MTRDITSWPSWSTPNGWAPLGPSGLPNSSVRLRFCTYGPGSPRIFTISGAAIATITRKTTKRQRDHRDAVLAKRRQNSCSGERAAISSLASRTSRASARPGGSRRRRRSSPGFPCCTERLPKSQTLGRPVRVTMRPGLRSRHYPHLLPDTQIRPFTRLVGANRLKGWRSARRGILAGWTPCSPPPRERGGADPQPDPGAAAGSEGSAAGRAHAPAQPRGVRRAVAPARRGLGAAHRDRAGPSALDGPVRAAGVGQDDARADGRRALAGGVRGAERGAGGARGGARGDRARRPPPRGQRRPRPCSSSTRSTASTRPSRTRCCRRSRRA